MMIAILWSLVASLLVCPLLFMPPPTLFATGACGGACTGSSNITFAVTIANMLNGTDGACNDCNGNATFHIQGYATTFVVTLVAGSCNTIVSGAVTCDGPRGQASN